MEFMISYGWAFMILIVAIFTLTYLGVLSPDNFLQKKCKIQPGPSVISCNDLRINENSVTIVIRNGKEKSEERYSPVKGDIVRMETSAKRDKKVGPVSNAQAKRMLETARVQKRITPRSALNTYDEILERYPNTLEAEETKLQIKSIIRRIPRLKKERERQNKYTGS